MSVTRTILSAAAVRELDLHAGDSVHVLTGSQGSLIVQVRRSSEHAGPRPEKAVQWAQQARGSVRLEPGQTADDARRAYYTEKHGLQK